MLPIPGYVAKKIQATEECRLKKADTRVETVTEGVIFQPTLVRHILNVNMEYRSHECHSDDQVVRVGDENAGQDSRKAGR
jgi:hypothetical protein